MTSHIFCAEAYDEIIGYVNPKVESIEDSWEQLVFGCQAFLEIVQREDLRRLVLVEAPAVLAVDTLVEFDRSGFGLLRQGIERVFSEGKLDTIDPEGFAHLINGALNELATWVARSDDPRRLQTAQKLIETLLVRHQI